MLQVSSLKFESRSLGTGSWRAVAIEGLSVGLGAGEDGERCKLRSVVVVAGRAAGVLQVTIFTT